MLALGLGVAGFGLIADGGSPWSAGGGDGRVQAESMRHGPSGVNPIESLQHECVEFAAQVAELRIERAAMLREAETRQQDQTRQSEALQALRAENDELRQRCESEAARAEEQASQRARLVRLAKARHVERLCKQAETLWPIHPRRVPELEAWLLEAREWVAREPALRASLRSLHDRALAVAPWIYASEQETCEHDLLSELVDAVESLSRPTGLIAQVADRLDRSRTLSKRSVARYSKEWAEAIRSIADEQSSPLFGGLRLRPQLGLAPLRHDPRSGLWEFVDVSTGRLPLLDGHGRIVAGPEDGIVLVLLPGGRLPALGGRPEIDIAPFFISKYELTQGQFARLKGQSPSTYSLSSHPGLVVDESHPVETVNWSEARSALGRTGLELPTEEQWEYAARAGTTSIWWTGNDVRSLHSWVNLADRFALEHGGEPEWAYERELFDGWVVHAPADTMAANAFGLHHVAGNVAEWCLGTGNLVPARGGSYLDDANALRMDRCIEASRSDRLPHVGIRAARSIEEGSQ